MVAVVMFINTRLLKRRPVGPTLAVFWVDVTSSSCLPNIRMEPIISLRCLGTQCLWYQTEGNEVVFTAAARLAGLQQGMWLKSSLFFRTGHWHCQVFRTPAACFTRTVQHGKEPMNPVISIWINTYLPWQAFTVVLSKDFVQVNYNGQLTWVIG